MTGGSSDMPLATQYRKNAAIPVLFYSSLAKQGILIRDVQLDVCCPGLAALLQCWCCTPCPSSSLSSEPKVHALDPDVGSAAL